VCLWSSLCVGCGCLVWYYYYYYYYYYYTSAPPLGLRGLFWGDLYLYGVISRRARFTCTSWRKLAVPHKASGRFSWIWIEAWRCAGIRVMTLVVYISTAVLLHKVITYIGTAVAQWLRCCATNRKFAGSIAAGISGFFIEIKSFWSHYGSGVDSASNRNEYQEYFLGVKEAGALGWQPTTILCRCHEIWVP